ncbi:hypothetical protein DRN69_09335 [Candidatus Pacearchaeota archaeon]|nr:MAG: hypothetical protein DRN69_09335 [Candidatus Pacearchaeota archaeon]
MDYKKYTRKSTRFSRQSIKKKSYKKIFFVFIGIFVLIASVYVVFFLKSSFSGKAVLEVNTNYKKGEPLEGMLKLSLSEGELIPATSKIIFETSEQKYEYDLNEILSGEQAEGDFYINGESISGTGSGYGLIGKKTTYPDVYFTLKISSDSEISSDNENEEALMEEEQELVSESLQEEVENQSINNTEDNKEIDNIESEEINIEEEEPEVEVTEEVEEGAEEQEGKVGLEEDKTEEVPETSSPITGNIIFRLSKGISNLFQGVMTGNVVLEVESGIDGKVSKDNPFTYKLKKGQTAEILSGSVRTDSEKLSDDVVKLDITEDIVTVTTEYSETETGFGEEYLGEGEREFEILLSDLNLMFEGDELKISLVYNDREILSLTKELKEGEIITNETTVNETITNESEANKVEVEITQETDFLTDSEKQTLIKEFGGIPVKVTKAEVSNGRVVIRYELGDYWFEPSYESYFSEDELKMQIERDRIRWLKDLANTLSSKKTTDKEEIKELIGDYSLE